MMATSQAKKPNKGDRIEFDRGLYSHWALYIGDDQVIHMRGLGNERININSTHFFSIYGQQFDKAEVAIDLIRDVIKDDKAYINNGRDSTWTPRSADEIVRQAMKYVGPVKYNILYANCENFVNWCRYGKWFSDQAENVKTAVRAARWVMTPASIADSPACVAATVLSALREYWETAP